MNVIVIATALIAYFIGAIPVGYIVARLKGIKDIREHGSGNIGATNVSRVLGTHYFFLIFFLDAGKAFLYIYCISPYYPLNYLCFFASIMLIANIFSIFLQGNGGKGVSTFCGLLFALQPLLALAMVVTWAILLVATHTVGIASVGAIVCVLLLSAVFFDYFLILFCLFSVLLICWTHKINVYNFYKKYSFSP